MTERLLTKKEAAEILAVSERTVSRLVAAGELHALKLGAAVRFHPAELDRLMGLPVVATDPAPRAQPSPRSTGDSSTRAGRDAVPADRQFEEPISDGQLRAFHAKLNWLDRTAKKKPGTTKLLIMEWLGEQLGREVESSRDLTAREANLGLDQLELWRDELLADGGDL